MSDFLVSFPGLGIEDWPLNRVAFTIGSLEVYWYGVIITIGVVLSLILALRDAKKKNLDEDFLLDNFIVIVFGALIGARAYYVIFEWDQFAGDLGRIFDIRQGGLAFYGGVIGAILAMWILHAFKKKNLLDTMDFVAVYLPLGQAIGRWGNFVNQEAFGTNTDLPWGMISNGTTNYLNAHPELGQNPNLPVHPTFLYESIGNLILFFILYRVREKSGKRGTTVAAYMIGYGIIRFFVEGLRTDSLYVGDTGIRASQLLSLVIVVIGVAYLIYLRFSNNKALVAKEEEVFAQAEADVSAEEAEEAGLEGATVVETDEEVVEVETDEVVVVETDDTDAIIIEDEVEHVTDEEVIVEADETDPVEDVDLEEDEEKKV